MKVAKVLTRFALASSDPAELHRVARALGSELSHNHVDTLREFRAQLACVPIGTQDDASIDEVSYATGYVAGLSDVSAEYEAAIKEDESATELSDDVARGIHIAVQLFQHAFASPYGSRSALHAVAAGVLGDSLAAADAVALWESESQAAGLLGRTTARTTLSQPGAVPQAVTAVGSTPATVPGKLLWERAKSPTLEPSRPSLLRAMTEPLYDDDSEPSRPIPITG